MGNNANNLQRMDVNAANFNELARWRYCLNLSIPQSLHLFLQ